MKFVAFVFDFNILLQKKKYLEEEKKIHRFYLHLINY